MARQRRYRIASIPQHLIQRGNNRGATFFGDEDYRYYLDCLKRASAEAGCAVHAYVLMTNHVHLLATPSNEAALSEMMQAVGRRYVRYINHRYRRTGTLWEGRYRAAVIDSDAYLLRCYRYLELNPVRAGIVHHPGEYSWSSYRHHAGDADDELIQEHEVYVNLGAGTGERRAAYREFCEQGVDGREIRQIQEATERGWVLGDERFRLEIEATCERRAQPRSRGGDRRSARWRDTFFGCATEQYQD
jgi:putative transposase